MSRALPLLFADRAPEALTLTAPSTTEAGLAGMDAWRASATRKAAAAQLRAELATFGASAEPPAEAPPLVLTPSPRGAR